MCIYYGNKSNLTYEKQEHVFPAGLGGIAMLSKGVVSDQANDLFSPLEAELMHNSLVSIPRALFGPGKRGSHSPKKASTSNVSVMKNTDGKIALGYLSGRSGYYINSLYKKEDEYIFTVASEQHDFPELAWESFKNEVKAFDTRFVRVSTNDLNQDEWVFGSYKGKYYLAMGPHCELESVKRQLLFIADSSKSGALNRKSGHPKVDVSLIESDSISRMYAKVAINVLTMLKGEEYICHSRFEPIKNWILGESDVDAYSQLPRVTPENKLYVPEDCHWCIFMIHNKKLCATVCFYNTFSRCFELANSVVPEDYDKFGPFFGLICDWRNKKELTLDQWILRYMEQMESI